MSNSHNLGISPGGPLPHRPQTPRCLLQFQQGCIKSGLHANLGNPTHAPNFEHDKPPSTPGADPGTGGAGNPPSRLSLLPTLGPPKLGPLPAAPWCRRPRPRSRGPPSRLALRALRAAALVSGGGSGGVGRPRDCARTRHSAGLRARCGGQAQQRRTVARHTRVRAFQGRGEEAWPATIMEETSALPVA